MPAAADLRLGRKRRAGGALHPLRCWRQPARAAPRSPRSPQTNPPPKPPPRQPLPPQPQAVEHDGDGAEGHGGAGPHGIQEQTGDGEKRGSFISRGLSLPSHLME